MAAQNRHARPPLFEFQLFELRLSELVTATKLPRQPRAPPKLSASYQTSYSHSFFSSQVCYLNATATPLSCRENTREISLVYSNNSLDHCPGSWRLNRITNEADDTFVDPVSSGFPETQGP